MNDDVDPVTDLLQAAFEGISARDESLAGAQLKRWLVVTEHEWADGHATLSTFQSPEVAPWDTLGFLRFVATVEERRVARMADDVHGD